MYLFCKTNGSCSILLHVNRGFGAKCCINGVNCSSGKHDTRFLPKANTYMGKPFKGLKIECTGKVWMGVLVIEFG
jgi:hypothetical protein